jgi:hypothetical protein
VPGGLAYSQVADGRDTFLEEVCRTVDSVGRLIEAENLRDPQAIWTEWLVSHSQAGPGVTRQLSNGIWRITLPPASFGASPKLALSRLGSYELRYHHFAQLWCDDPGLRRAAALQRTLSLTRRPDLGTIDDLLRVASPLARTLEVSPPTFVELRAHAAREANQEAAQRLDAMAAPVP